MNPPKEFFDETRELLAFTLSQLNKAKRGLARVNVNVVSVSELLKNAQRANRAARRTLHKESKL